MRNPTLAALALVAGCYYDEGLDIDNIHGTVVLPEAAAQRTIVIDGTNTLVTDVRLIGPVILGLYPDISESQFAYPHPVTGPAFSQDSAGDTFPYGGTTIGDIRFACMQALTCKVTSGRFSSYDNIVDWFNMVGTPLEDSSGNPVTTGEYLRQTCFQILEAVADEDVRLVPPDQNDDGAVDGADLDFVQRNDGMWEADFTVWQQEMFGDVSTGAGFKLWGWMDSPNFGTYDFKTCDRSNGFQQQEYNQQFAGGRQFRDLLNHPSNYIEIGDWVSGAAVEITSLEQQPELQIDFVVEDL